MDFEWDEVKNQSNIIKHGIDFADVGALFQNPYLIELDDRFDYGEDRWISIGIVEPLVIVVIWTERYESTIRIISARKANAYERQRYQTFIADRLDAASSDE